MIKIILPIVLIIGIIGGVYLVQNRVNLFPKADTGNFEDKITISNLTSTSFAVSYFTKQPTYDYLQYGTDQTINNLAVDSRVGANGLNPQLFTHYFEVKNLTPNTKYYFKIHSGSRYYPEGQYLTQTTPAEISGVAPVESFSGTVKMRSGEKPPEESIVFISTEKGQLLSAPMTASGDWSITFNGMRTADLASYYSIPDTDIVKYLAYSALDGFGIFQAYALKHTNIDIKIDNDAVPFYKISVDKPASASSSGTPQSDQGGFELLNLRQLLKF